jgi:hypothetical protein
MLSKLIFWRFVSWAELGLAYSGSNLSFLWVRGFLTVIINWLPRVTFGVLSGWLGYCSIYLRHLRCFFSTFASKPGSSVGLVGSGIPCESPTVDGDWTSCSGHHIIWDCCHNLPILSYTVASSDAYEQSVSVQIRDWLRPFEANQMQILSKSWSSWGDRFDISCLPITAC